jgi:hypothetical protein
MNTGLSMVICTVVISHVVGVAPPAGCNGGGIGGRNILMEEYAQEVEHTNLPMRGIADRYTSPDV